MIEIYTTLIKINEAYLQLRYKTNRILTHLSREVNKDEKVGCVVFLTAREAKRHCSGGAEISKTDGVIK